MLCWTPPPCRTSQPARWCTWRARDAGRCPESPQRRRKPLPSTKATVAGQRPRTPRNVPKVVRRTIAWLMRGLAVPYHGTTERGGASAPKGAGHAIPEVGGQGGGASAVPGAVGRYHDP